MDGEQYETQTRTGQVLILSGCHKPVDHWGGQAERFYQILNREVSVDWKIKQRVICIDEKNVCSEQEQPIRDKN